MGKRGYIGQYCTIESNVKVGDSAVVHEFARILFHALPEIKQAEIAIRTPTSILLYQQCDSGVFSDEYVQLFFFYNFKLLLLHDTVQNSEWFFISFSEPTLQSLQDKRKILIPLLCSDGIQIFSLTLIRYIY